MFVEVFNIAALTKVFSCSSKYFEIRSIKVYIYNIKTKRDARDSYDWDRAIGGPNETDASDREVISERKLAGGRIPPKFQSHPGFNFSVEFRRNFGVFFVFASYREEKFRYFSFSNLKIQKYL